jgi:hypothetical protein
VYRCRQFLRLTIDKKKQKTKNPRFPRKKKKVFHAIILLEIIYPIADSNKALKNTLPV